MLPRASATEAGLERDAIVCPATSLLAVCVHVTGRSPLARLTAVSPASGTPIPTHPDLADLADVRGQEQAKRALTIAAAGAHSLLSL